jgi:hypothetical protein
MTQLTNRSMVCWFALCVALCGVGQSSESADPLKKALADTLSIEKELAIVQKRFSIMSREMAETEMCAARELLSTSTYFREVTEQALMVGQMVGEMKSAEDQSTSRKYLGMAAHGVVVHGDTDLQLVNEFLEKMRTPQAKEEAMIIRGHMMELRTIWKAYASEKW